MLMAVGGGLVLAVTSGVFWGCLPRGDEVQRFVGTMAEPLVGVGVCAGFALGFTMILAGVLGYFGGS